MILIGFSASKIVVGILCVSLGLLVLIIAYRKLLAYLSKGRITSEKYCVLRSLDNENVKGEVEFYFTCEEPKNVTFEILNDDFSFNREVKSKDYEIGGHIIRFDSTLVSNGSYFYQLRTENQKTTKKIFVNN
jgi:hypothetical protein